MFLPKRVTLLSHKALCHTVSLHHTHIEAPYVKSLRINTHPCILALVVMHTHCTFTFLQTIIKRSLFHPLFCLFVFIALIHAHLDTYLHRCTYTHMHKHTHSLACALKGRTATRFVLFKPVKHGVIIFLTVLQTEFISSLINHHISNTVQLN